MNLLDREANGTHVHEELRTKRTGAKAVDARVCDSANMPIYNPRPNFTLACSLGRFKTMGLSPKQNITQQAHPASCCLNLNERWLAEADA